MGSLLLSLIFRGHRKIMKNDHYSHHMSFLGCRKFYFVILFFFLFYLVFCFLYFVIFKLVSFIWKENTFLQRSLWKSILKIHLESLGSKSYFFFQKYATISHSVYALLFSIKIWFWVKCESKLEVSNRWESIC